MGALRVADGDDVSKSVSLKEIRRRNAEARRARNVAAPPPKRESLSTSELVAWLAFRAHNGEVLTEGQIAAAMGGGILRVRELCDAGRAIDEAMRAAWAERVRAEATK